MTLSGVVAAVTQNQGQTTTSTTSSSSSGELDPIKSKDVDLRAATTGIRLLRKGSGDMKKTVRFALAEDEEKEEQPGKEKKVFGKESFKMIPQEGTEMPTMPVPSTFEDVPRRTWLNPEERHKYVRKSLALNQSSPSLFTHLTESPGPVSSENRRRALRPTNSVASGLRKSSSAVERKPWIEGSVPGQIEIKDDIVTQTKVLHPDTTEMTWLKEKFGWLLIDGPLADLIGFIMVAPLTNLTCFSLYYQLYLNEIFHTHTLTRLGHFIFMPITYFWLFAFAAQFNLFDMGYHHDVSFLAFKPLTVPFIMALSFIAWHLSWGFLSNTYLLGVFMLPVTIGVYLSANFYVAYFGVEDFAIDPETRFLATVWYATPLFWLLLSGLFQASSHLFESSLPPRMNLTARWLTWPEFIRINCPNKRKFVAWFLTSTVCGVFDEIVASPRLLPLYVLHIFFILGYHSDEFAKIKALAHSAMQYKNPALDFIGTGGALQPSAGDYLYEKKPEDIQHELEYTHEIQQPAAVALTQTAPVPVPLSATAPAPAAMINAVASITAAPAFRTIKRRSRSGSFTG